ncbi:MAG TPA: hypothetical protein VGZ22_06045, partial [Isosphaeraceae bacterium]|nr:hypothetical protein [Isosphaeraceae bacterium]
IACYDTLCQLDRVECQNRRDNRWQREKRPCSELKTEASRETGPHGASAFFPYSMKRGAARFLTVLYNPGTFLDEDT